MNIAPPHIFRARRVRQARGEGGQSLVEFAFSVPVLVLLFVGVVGFAWLLYFFVTLNSCAREGARYVVGHPQATEAEVANYVKQQAGTLNRNIMTVIVEPADPDERSREAQVTVRVSYPFQIINVTVPYIVMPGSFTIFPPIYFYVESTMNMD